MWVIIRASGIVAYVLLALSAIWGLLVSSTLLGRAASAKRLTYAHESLSIGALLATATHAIALTYDEYVPFSVADVVVQGASDWVPTATAFGVVAAWGLLVVTLSFYVRRHIGRRIWRIVHFGAFGVFAAALLHGVTVGTDTSLPVMWWIYVVSGGAVAALTIVRVALVGVPLPPRPGRRAP
jgi:predicted ferric reductase